MMWPVFRDALPERSPRLCLPPAPGMLFCHHRVYERARLAMTVETEDFDRVACSARSPMDMRIEVSILRGELWTLSVANSA